MLIRGIVWLCGCLSILAAAGSSAEAPIREPDQAVVSKFRALMNRPAILEQAEQQLIAACMRRSGLPYPEVPPSSLAEPVEGLLRLPSALSPEIARKHGYPASLMVTKQRSVETAVHGLARSLPAATRGRFYVALLGNRSGDQVRVRLTDDEVTASSTGCVAEARAQLYGSVANYLTVFYVPQFAQRHIGDVSANPDLRTAFQEYAQCMTAANYSVATPAEAVDLAKSYYPGGIREIADGAEIALATADAQCRHSVQLHETYQAAADRIARHWISSHEAAVIDAYRHLQTAVSAAHGVIGR